VRADGDRQPVPGNRRRPLDEDTQLFLIAPEAIEGYRLVVEDQRQAIGIGLRVGAHLREDVHCALRAERRPMAQVHF